MLYYYGIMAAIHVALWIYLVTRRGRGMYSVTPFHTGLPPHSEASLRYAIYGFALSGVSYLMHAVDYVRHDKVSPAGVYVGMIGTMALFWAWMEYIKVIAKYRASTEAAGVVETPVDPLSVDIDGASVLVVPMTASALAQAHDQAARQQADAVDTEHILLGLLELGDAPATRILERVGARATELRAALCPKQMAGSRSWRSKGSAAAVRSLSTDGLHYSPKAAEAIKLASMEASRFGEKAIGTEHLLLGLALKGTGAAAQALYSTGATADVLRIETQALTRARVDARRQKALNR